MYSKKECLNCMGKQICLNTSKNTAQPQELLLFAINVGCLKRSTVLATDVAECNENALV